MKICICDDEKDFIHNFQLLLKQYSKKHKNINQFNSFENENDLLSYFYAYKKSKNRIIRINTGILSNMKQKIKEFYH